MDPGWCWGWLAMVLRGGGVGEMLASKACMEYGINLKVISLQYIKSQYILNLLYFIYRFPFNHLFILKKFHKKCLLLLISQAFELQIHLSLLLTLLYLEHVLMSKLTDLLETTAPKHLQTSRQHHRHTQHSWIQFFHLFYFLPALQGFSSIHQQFCLSA